MRGAHPRWTGKGDGRIIRTFGTKIDPINHKVEVDNELINSIKTKTYIAFHKPKGVLSTMSDPENRPCLADYCLVALMSDYFM